MKKIIVLVFFTCFAVAENTKCIVIKDLPGCQSKELWHKIMTFTEVRDSEAIRKTIHEGFAIKNCIMLEKGTVVFLTSQDTQNGYGRVRPRGVLEEYWTSLQVLKKL